MKHITPRGWFVIWVLTILVVVGLGELAGSWDISEICAVEGVGCPDDLNK